MAAPPRPSPLPPTLRQSFYLPMPPARRQAGAPERYNTHGSSSTSGVIYTPPSTALEVDLGVWLHMADEVLNNPATHILDTSYLATWEGSSRMLRNENDVVDAATCQLSNPVDLAFTSFHSHANIVLLHEHNATLNGSDNRARVDRAWSIENDWENPFVLLEAKRTGTIDPDQFIYAMNDGSRSLNTNTAINLTETAFHGNSYKLMSQAVKYRGKFNTPYVAFFDWDHLVLAVLQDVSENEGGAFSWLTVVSDPLLMRRALLGFMRGAYRHCLEDDPSFLPLHPKFRVIGQKSKAKARGPANFTSRSGRSSYKPSFYGESQYDNEAGGPYRYASNSNDDFGMEHLSLRDSKEPRHTKSSRHRERDSQFSDERDYYTTDSHHHADAHSRKPRYVAQADRSDHSRSSRPTPFGLDPEDIKTISTDRRRPDSRDIYWE